MSCGNPHELPCDEAQLEATAWIDEEYSLVEVARLEQHFRECPDCVAESNLAKAIKGLVNRSCHDKAPDDLRQRVVARIAHVQVTITQSQGSQVFGFVVDQQVTDGE